MDSGNPYGLDDFNDFNDDALNDFYISDFSSNNYSATVSNNSTTLTIKSKAMSINCIIFPTNE